MQKNPDISVVIPTFNRSVILKQCLECLEVQTLSSDRFEVIVVDDGSTDDMGQVLGRFKVDSPFRILSLRQQNQGQGIARNLGIQKASGNIVVLIGDDILVDPSFLSEHLKWHEAFQDENVAVLGLIDWHPSLSVTPFMKWLTNGSSVFGRFGGHQFAFEKLSGQEWADFNFFYTSNLSLKRSLLLRYPFDADFNRYGWEDIELGYRLTHRAGLRLRYAPGAVGYHLHALTEETLAPRMRLIGRSAWIIHGKYPELGKIPSLWKRFVFRCFSCFPALFILSFCKRFSSFGFDFYYYALSKRYFLEGLRDGRPRGLQLHPLSTEIDSLPSKKTICSFFL